MIDRVEWIPVATAAERLGLTYRRVLQLVHEHSLAAVRGPDGVLRLPADFLMVEEPQIVRGLPGLLTVLADAGYSDDEAIGWLFTEDPSLEGTPMRAIRAGRSTEVKRRAQALGF